MHGDVVLVNPARLRSSSRDAGVRERYPYPPLGLLSIAGQLLAHGYRPILLDFFREDLGSKAAFQERLRATVPRPLLVGVCTYTETIHDAVRIATAVREALPRTPIVFGGPHATFCWEEILAENAQVDFAVRGEGEGALIELLEHLQHPDGFPAEGIAGLVFRRPDGRLQVNPARGFVTDMDCLPLPPYHLLPVSRGLAGDNVFIFMTSRGCPSTCVFCASRAMSGGAYRMYSAEWLISLVYFFAREVRFVSMGIMDDTFLVNLPRLRLFCRYLDDVGIRVPWTCKSRVDTVNPKTIGILGRTRCRSIHIGVESADDGVLKSIDKKITLDKVLAAIRVMKEAGIRPECSFILGHHGDTLETIDRTLLLARAIRDRNIGISIIGICTPLPGTPLHRRADEFGLHIVTRDWSRYDLNTPIFYTDRFSIADIKRAQYWFDVESRRGAPFPNLSGKDLSEFEALLEEFLASLSDVHHVENMAHAE